MLEMMKVNRVAFQDLMNVGPKRWSRAYSPVSHYRLMTSSIAESMNLCLDGNKDGLVNLSEKTCSCMKFQVDKLPCRHALAAIRFAKKPVADFCGDCYKTTSWVEAYSRNIFPVGHPSDWTILEDVSSRVVYPPPFRAQAGRPKKKRFKSAGNIEMERQKIAQFVVNPVTTDKIVKMLNHVRFLYHLQHLQHL
ncbi:hypothetical protein LWI29_022968 [Acer saccharum]|uniref:SWIM-type domain-containing protein n=1 Tax=Acer saccharum TaxID=4024 RepID=A0AA39S4P4_ACESA|nr:hypothetical protein LWI29_022968 [Acer saccharum]